MKMIRKPVFGIPVLILLIAMVVYVFWPGQFIFAAETINVWIGQKFGWLYCFAGLLMCCICAYVYFSPLGNKIIGGEEAKPLLNKWNWFCVALCTTMAAGILFWSTAEPVIHLTEPPDFLGLEPSGYAASIFSMSTMFLHWGITPYAIYCVPALLFAFVYYNMKKSYSFNNCLIPLLGEKFTLRIGTGVDSLCLFITATGLAASLGMGILSVVGGLAEIFNFRSEPIHWVLAGAGIVVTFIASSASGLMKGIKFLSGLNTKIFIGLLMFAFLFGPTSFLCSYFSESFGYYISHFFEKSLMLGGAANSDWTRLWSVQYFGSWLAWAPMTALFLGKIAYGHRFKDFIVFNLVLPAMFSMVWVGILGGNAVHMQLNGSDLIGLINQSGTESALYQVFRNLPIPVITLPLLAFTVFLSFVTAADSATNAMAGLCIKTSGNSAGEPPKSVKIILGILIGVISIIMVIGKGIDGVKILSTIAGFPAAVLITLVGVSLVRVAKAPDKFI